MLAFIISRLLRIFSSLVSFVESGLFGAGFYRRVVLMVLGGFLLIRLPFVFGPVGLFVFVIFFVCGLFLAAFFCRLVDPSLFFSSFMPEGVSIGFGLFVCFVEVISYLIRPLVLMLRPMMNLSIGWLAGHQLLGLMCFWGLSNWFVYSSFKLLEDFSVGYFFLLLLLGYEWCVGCVQWYIIEKIVLTESEF